MVAQFPQNAFIEALRYKKQQEAYDPMYDVAKSFAAGGLTGYQNALTERAQKRKNAAELFQKVVTDNNIIPYKMGQDGKPEQLSMQDILDAGEKIYNGQKPEGIFYQRVKKETAQSQQPIYTYGADGVKNTGQTFTGTEAKFLPIPSATAEKTEPWGKQQANNKLLAAIQAMGYYRGVGKNRNAIAVQTKEDAYAAATEFGSNLDDPRIAAAIQALPSIADVEKNMSEPEPMGIGDLLKGTLTKTTFDDIKAKKMEEAKAAAIEKMKKGTPAQQDGMAAQTQSNQATSDKVIVQKDGRQYRLPRRQLKRSIGEGYSLVQ